MVDEGDSSSADDFLRAVARAPAREPEFGEPDPTRVGRFRVIARLGRGGMGIVYRAEDEKLGRSVALKVLPPALAMDADKRRGFLREARSAAAITHANVATLYEADEADDRVFIAMELVEGETLRRVIERGAMPWQRAVRVAQGILRGLAAAHARGIVHRDLKPDNLIIDVHGEPKILDFGLAKLRERAAAEEPSAQSASHTDDAILRGTPAYMSPEQAQGKRVDARSDLFSFGVVLYEMLVAQRPFRGETPGELLVAICRDAPDPPSSRRRVIPKALDGVVARCLAKMPDDRYPDARAVLAELDAIADASASIEGAVTARRSSRAANAFAMRYSPLLAAIAIGGAVASLAWTRRSPPRDVAPIATAPSATSASDVRPLSGRPEAIAAFEAGMQRFRDGAYFEWVRDFERAVAIDPALAAAHLRLSLASLVLSNDVPIEASRDHLRAALAHRATLDAHDVELLAAVEPALRQPSDTQESERRLVAALTAHPGDADFAYWLALARSARDPRGSIDALDTALRSDPAFAAAWERKGWLLWVLGRTEEARAAFDACIAAAPSATGCLRGRVTWFESEGQCERAAEDDHRLIALDGSEAVWHRRLARALYAMGQPREAVQTSLDRANERWPEAEREYRMLRQGGGLSLPILEGDFVVAENRFLELQKIIASTSGMEQHWGADQDLAMLYLEMGRPADAAKIADAHLRRLRAWTPDPSGVDESLEMRIVLRQAGTLSRDDFAKERDAWLARSEGTPRSWLDLSSTQGTRSKMWRQAYTFGAESEDDARDALEALPRFQPLLVRPFQTPADEFNLGRVYALAGRTDEAIVLLRRAARSCAALEFPISHTRAHRWLGEALEKSGDTAGACAAYKVVLDRWGNARPRSVTADFARARVRALACSK